MGNQRGIDVTESPEIHETRYQGIGKAGIIMIKINGKYGMLFTRSVK